MLNNLSALDLDLSLKDGGTLPKLSSVLGDLVVKAKSVSVPGFEGIGSLDDFNLKLPASGGNYQFAQASGNANLSINIGSKPTKVAIAVHEGKVSAKVKSEVDIHELAPALSGKIKVGIDTTAAEKLSIEATDVHATDPELAKQLVVSKASYKNGKLTASASVAGQLSYGGMTLNVAESNLNIDTSASPGFSGNAKFSIAGEGAKADITATVNKEGKLDIAGESDIDLAQVTGGAVTGKVHAAGGSAGGLKKFAIAGAKIYRRPFDAVVIKSIGYDKGSDHLDLDLEVKADAINVPGLKLDKLDWRGALRQERRRRRSRRARVKSDGPVRGRRHRGRRRSPARSDLQGGRRHRQRRAQDAGAQVRQLRGDGEQLQDRPRRRHAQGGGGLGAVDQRRQAGGPVRRHDEGEIWRQRHRPVRRQRRHHADAHHQAGEWQATWKPGKGTTFKVEGLLNDLAGHPSTATRTSTSATTARRSTPASRSSPSPPAISRAGPSAAASRARTSTSRSSRPTSGQAWTFGNIAIALAGKQKLQYATATGAAGEVKGKVSIGEASVAVGAKFANSKITVSADAENIEIHDIISPLSGKFSISYDSEKKDLKSKGSGIRPSDPELGKALQVDAPTRTRSSRARSRRSRTRRSASGRSAAASPSAPSRRWSAAGRPRSAARSAPTRRPKRGRRRSARSATTPTARGSSSTARSRSTPPGSPAATSPAASRSTRAAAAAGCGPRILNFAKGPLAGKIDVLFGRLRHHGALVRHRRHRLGGGAQAGVAELDHREVGAQDQGLQGGRQGRLQGRRRGQRHLRHRVRRLLLGLDHHQQDPGRHRRRLDHEQGQVRRRRLQVHRQRQAQLRLAPSSPKHQGRPELAPRRGQRRARHQGQLDRARRRRGQRQRRQDRRHARRDRHHHRSEILGQLSDRQELRHQRRRDLQVRRPGLLDPGAKLALGYGSDTGFRASAENIVFNAGALKGLTVVKAWFTTKGANKGWGINVKGGVDVALSDDIKAHIDDSSNFTASGAGRRRAGVQRHRQGQRSRSATSPTSSSSSPAKAATSRSTPTISRAPRSAS